MSKFTKKCMAIRTLSDTASGCHTFLCQSQSKLAWLTPNLGILWISVCSFWLCGSIVANPIIYRLVPSPSRFEIRQCVEPVVETLSTTTGATTTAYRKQIFCSGHAQKLNNWLQPAVVFTFATPHSLFWRSVDNVAVYCKVFSPFLIYRFFSYDT